MKIINIVGARPNFMKIAPIVRAIQCHNDQIKLSTAKKNSRLESILVHTGQHYDYKISQVFLNSWKFQAQVFISELDLEAMPSKRVM